MPSTKLSDCSCWCCVLCGLEIKARIPSLNVLPDADPVITTEGGFQQSFASSPIASGGPEGASSRCEM